MHFSLLVQNNSWGEIHVLITQYGQELPSRSGLAPLRDIQSLRIPIHRSLVGGEGQDDDVPDFRALGTSTFIIT